MTDPQQTSNDEISLVDLLAVLVRYRRLIVRGTLAAVVLGAAVLIGLPAVGITSPYGRLYTAELQILVTPVPEELATYVPFNVAANLEALMRNYRFVGREYRTVQRESDPDQTSEQYFTMVREEIIGRVLKHEYDPDTQILAISYTSTDRQEAVEFLDLLSRRLREEITPRIEREIGSGDRVLSDTLDFSQTLLADLVEQASRAVRGQEDLIDAEDVLRSLDSPTRNVIQAFSDLALRRRRLQILGQNPSFPYRVVDEPIVFLERSAAAGRLTRLIVIAFASGFFFVFLAFVLQYVDSVKKNESEYSKLRSAWERK